MSSIHTRTYDARMVCDDVMRSEPDYPVRRPAYEPGCHIEVEIEVQGQREERPYFSVRRISDNRLIIAVRRLYGGMGGALFAHEQNIGDRLLASLPASHVTSGFSAPAVELLTGGTGITPLIGMARGLRQKQMAAPSRLAGGANAVSARLKSSASKALSIIATFCFNQRQRDEDTQLCACVSRGTGCVTIEMP